jgi:hypothetical protein
MGPERSHDVRFFGAHLGGFVPRTGSRAHSTAHATGIEPQPLAAAMVVPRASSAHRQYPAPMPLNRFLRADGDTTRTRSCFGAKNGWQCLASTNPRA